MHADLTILVLVAGALAITWVCRRLELPAPLVLVVVGIGVSFVPGVEIVEFDPELVMLIVLTPLLYSAALESSYLDIRANARAIGLLAVGLPAFTAVAVGLVAWWTVPGLPLTAALVLGAIVAPPDAVSALAIGRRLGLPRRLMTILGGESLVNDATAITLFRVFLALATGTGISAFEAGWMFVLAAVGGTVIGLAVGWVVHRIRRKLDDPRIESALGLVVPFGVYLIAESAEASGVLAVVVAGLYLGFRAPEGGYATRLQEQAVWQASDTILDGVVFALIGLQITTVIRNVELLPLLLAGCAITATAIVARVVWIYPATYLPRLLSKRIAAREPRPPWQSIVVVSWTGMRGVVTLAAAFAIPLEFTDPVTQTLQPVAFRDTVVFLAFFVTVATLLLHGLTLPTLIRRLGVRAESGQAELLSEAQAQYDAVQASITMLDASVESSSGTVQHVAEKLRRFAQLNANGVWEQLGRPESETGESPAAAYRRLRREMLRTERQTFVASRNSGAIDDEILRKVLRTLDNEEAMLSRED